MDDYSALISQQQQANESLSERLAKIERQSKIGYDIGAEYLNGIGQVPMADPLLGSRSKLDLGTQAMLSSQNARDDLVAGQRYLTELLGQKENQRQFDENLKFEQDKEATNKLQELLDEQEKLSIADDYITQIKNGSLNLESVPAADRPAVVKRLGELGINVDKLQEEAKNQKLLEYAKQLYEIYYGNEGEKDDLAYGRQTGVLKNIYNKFIGPTDPEGRLSRYNNLKQSGVAGFKAFFGETGVLTDRDVARLMASIPSTTMTAEEAKNSWNDLFKRFGSSNPYGSSQSTSGFKVGNYDVVVE